MNKKIEGILKFEIDNEKVKKIGLYLLSFLIPMFIVMFAVSYLGIYPFGEDTYLPVDTYLQYTGFFDYFRDTFLGDSSIFYSLSKSIGGEMYGLFAYYLASPFNLVFLFFSKANTPFAFWVIFMLKTAAAGSTMFYYLNRKNGVKLSNLAFSCMYALSSYVINYGFNIMWLDGVILLPFIIAGVEDLLDYKKPLLYTITLSLAMITNYYIGFMICIFSVMYFVYKIICENVKSKKDILDKARKIHSVFCSFGIYCIICASASIYRTI